MTRQGARSRRRPFAKRRRRSSRRGKPRGSVWSAGAWVDRLRRRYILIVGDAARAILLAIIPILWALHDLRIWHLMILQFVIGIFTVFFDVAYQSYLPALIEREDLVDGNSKLQLTVSVSQVGGPPLAGVLIAALSAAYASVAASIR